MTAIEAVSLVAEVVSWITLPLGLVILVSGYLRTALSPEWLPSPAVILDRTDDSRLEHPDDRRWSATTGSEHERIQDRDTEEDTDSPVRVLRWFAGDGSVQESLLDARLSADLAADDDELVVYYDPDRPALARLGRPPRTGTQLVVLGWILAGVGIASFVLTFVILFAAP